MANETITDGKGDSPKTSETISLVALPSVRVSVIGTEF